MEDNTLIKIRITYRYDEVLGDVRHLQFVYSNGAVIGEAYDDIYSEVEFDVPFANQNNQKGEITMAQDKVYDYAITQDDLNDHEDDVIEDMIVNRMRDERRMEKLLANARQRLDDEEQAALNATPPEPEIIPPVPEGPTEGQ